MLCSKDDSLDFQQALGASAVLSTTVQGRQICPVGARDPGILGPSTERDLMAFKYMETEDFLGMNKERQVRKHWMLQGLILGPEMAFLGQKYVRGLTLVTGTDGCFNNSALSSFSRDK